MFEKAGWAGFGALRGIINYIKNAIYTRICIQRSPYLNTLPRGYPRAGRRALSAWAGLQESARWQRGRFRGSGSGGAPRAGGSLAARILLAAGLVSVSERGGLRSAVLPRGPRVWLCYRGRWCAGVALAHGPRDLGTGTAVSDVGACVICAQVRGDVRELRDAWTWVRVAARLDVRGATRLYERASATQPLVPMSGWVGVDVVLAR